MRIKYDDKTSKNLVVVKVNSNKTPPFESKEQGLIGLKD